MLASRRKEVSVPAPANNPPLLRFGPFQLDLQACELRKGETLLHLAPQPCKVLALLASNPHKVFTRQEIQQEIWGGETFVDFDQGLNAAIRQIRTALCDDAETPRYIETLPKRGYRFIGQIDVHPALAPTVEDGAKQTTRRFTLRRVAVLAVIPVAMVAVAVIANPWPWRESLFLSSRRPVRAIAALPLPDLSCGAAPDYLAHGMTDA